MTRNSYDVRGETIALEEESGVLAVRLAERRERTSDNMDEIVEELDLGTPVMSAAVARGVDPFAEAGWVFVRPSERVRRAVETNEAPDGTEFVGRVYRDGEGRPLVDTHHLTVKLDPEFDPDEAMAMLDDLEVTYVRTLGFAPNLFEVLVSESKGSLEAAARVSEAPEVVYAEPVFVEHVESRSMTALEPRVDRLPNDPRYGEQWQWPILDAPMAWSETRGTDTTIAVIDNGFDVNHEDLSDALTEATGYYSRGGIASDRFVRGTDNYPDANHGTMCAGMASAAGDNARGVCGAAWEASLTLVACLSDQVGTQTTLALSVAYAANPELENEATNAGLDASDGADVVVCSLGPSTGASWTMHSVLMDAIDSVVERGRGGLGAPVFWAVSNGNVPIEGPGGTDQVAAHANTIAVGRSNESDSEDGSAYGAALDLLAPGTRVLSTGSDDRYQIGTGTSYAAPCAAGVAALVIDADPDLGWEDVLWTMIDTCDDIGNVGEGHHDRYGFGRINAGAAVEEVVGGQVASRPSIVGPSTADAGADPPRFRVDLAGFTHYQVEFATRPELFHGENHGDERRSSNFFPMYGQESVVRQTLAEYVPSRAVWERLRKDGTSRIHYRVFTAYGETGWHHWDASIYDEEYAEAPSVRIVDEESRNGDGEAPLIEASVGAGGENRFEDVRALRDRLRALGFDWLETGSRVDAELRRTINLVQSIVAGRRQVRGDGRVDVPGPTYAWLTSANPPRWQRMPVGSRDGPEGFYNVEVAEQHWDDHEYGTSWLAATLESAGRRYQESYRSRVDRAAPITVNDASPRRGGDTPDHSGHETGLCVDLRLPRTDGTAPGMTTFRHPHYDREAMRAMVRAISEEPLLHRVLFNDPELIAEGLSTRAPGHDNHVHVEISPPERHGDGREVTEPVELEKGEVVSP
ncbi:S8 family peptidase [Natronorarus salvus]|uniref:S8 family peptidase n=1 Tax=Natronorarus salvus TaxID=3117733 RepID=UPI002F25EFBF